MQKIIASIIEYLGHSKFIYLAIYFLMCSLSLRINAHMKHAYNMFYNMRLLIGNNSFSWCLKICNDCCWIRFSVSPASTTRIWLLSAINILYSSIILWLFLHTDRPISSARVSVRYRVGTNSHSCLGYFLQLKSRKMVVPGN